MIASNQTIIYDIEKNIETILPDIPNGVRVTNPFDGSATLLPLSPPLYMSENSEMPCNHQKAKNLRAGLQAEGIVIEYKTCNQSHNL